MSKVIKLNLTELGQIINNVISEYINYAQGFPNIKFGDKNQSVQDFQKLLLKYDIDVGPDGPDGIFGKNTRNAVIKFQKKYGLEPTGIIDNRTRNFLYPVKSGPPRFTEKVSTKEPEYDCVAIPKEECDKLSPTSNILLGVGKETACAKYMNTCLRQFDKDMSGNAWTVLRNMKARDIATEKYNMFKEMKWNNIWNVVNNSVTKNTCECHKEDHADGKCKSPIPKLVDNSYLSRPNFDISKLEIGDIVGLYYRPSTNKGQAFCSRLTFDNNGKPIKTENFEFNSHVGFVVGIKKGVPIILHNIGGKTGGNRYATPATALLSKSNTMITWVASNNEVKKNLNFNKNTGFDNKIPDIYNFNRQ